MIYIHWIELLAYLLVIVAIMIKVLLDNRQPSRTMAWLLVLAFLPVVGIILYFFFGQNTRKERLISQRSLDELSKRNMLEFAEQRDLSLPPDWEYTIRLFTAQSMALPFKNNEAEIYTSGYDFFPSLLREIGRARHHIHILSFIFNDDPLGRLVADALIDKARGGVEVRVVYDDVANWRVPNAFYEHMRDAGIDVQPFMPVKFPVFADKMNYRNHRKLAVIDGRVGFIGGMNIALRYIKGTKTQGWRDTHMRVEGSAVYGIQRAFLIDWYFVDRTLITDHKYYPPVSPSINNGCLAQVVTSSPISKWPEIMQGYVSVILRARRYVYIETPYFIPTETILFALQTAATAGIDVRLMVPMRTDSLFTEWASRSYLRQAAAAGVKVYLYEAAFNHSKVLVVDDALATCGSANVDFRSLEHDFESNIFFYDADMAVRFRRMFLDDQARCQRLDEVEKRYRRTFAGRLWESLVRLLAPVL